MSISSILLLEFLVLYKEKYQKKDQKYLHGVYRNAFTVYYGVYWCIPDLM